MRSALFHRLLIGLVAGLTATSCSTSPPAQTPLMKSIEGVEITKRQLETLMYQFAAYYAGQVDLAASEIYTQAEDPQIRRSAIEWNTICVPEMMKHCFNGEPLVGLVSSWVFAAEVHYYFESGNGREVFGSYQEIAVEASRRLEGDLTKIMFAVLPEDSVRSFIPRLESWVVEHPIENQRFVSDVTSKKAIKAMGGEVASGLGAAGAMNEQMVALSARLNIMTAYLPRQISWQTAAVMEQSREAFDEMEQEALGSLDSILAFLAGQRVELAKDVAREREAILEAFTAERTAVLTHIEGQRDKVFQEIALERTEVLLELNNLTLMAIEQLMTESRVAMDGGINRLYRYAFQMLAAPLILMAIFVIVVMMWIRTTVNRLIDIKERQLGHHP